MTLLTPDGRKVDKRCPQCRAAEDKRINSAGFGPPVIICSECGYTFKEEELR